MIQSKLSHVGQFWKAWFGLTGREVGMPFRTYCQDEQAFLAFINSCMNRQNPSYVSVNPYSARNQLYGLEKLYFDFDCREDPNRAWIEAQDFAHVLIERFRVKPLLVFSGMKGYHVYVWLWNVVTITSNEAWFIKNVCQQLQQQLLHELHYHTLDFTPLGDVKRLARIPYTLHQESKQRCQPVFLSHDPRSPSSIDLEEHRRHGITQTFFSQVVKAVQQAHHQLTQKRKKYDRRVLSRIRAPIQQLMDRALRGERLGHMQRLAVACELIALRWRDDDICEIFRLQEDFNMTTTLYMIRHARKMKYRPFTIERLNRIINEP
jgi:hypothetical protein